MSTQIQLRRGTAAEWTAADPTLANGEFGIETDTNKIKIGDGATAWSSLTYLDIGHLGDVDTATAAPAAGDALVFDGTKWVPDSATFVAWESVVKHGAIGDGTTDDTLAVQAAVNAVEAVGGGVVYFPAGDYLVTALTVQAQGITFRGESRTVSHVVTATGDLFTLTGASRVRFESLLVESNPGGGHVFVIADSLSHGEWRDLRVVQDNDAKSVLQADDAGAGTLNYTDNLWEHIDVQHTQTATVPTFNLRGGAVNRNRWVDVRPTYSGEFVWLIETTAAGSYANDNVLEGVTGEVVNGGLFRGLGVKGTRLADIGIYDLQAVGATTNHLIEFGRSSGANLPSAANLLENVRRHAGALGAGLHDVHLESGGATLVNCGGQTALDVDFNSKEATVVGGNVTGSNDEEVRYVRSSGNVDSFLPSPGPFNSGDYAKFPNFIAAENSAGWAVTDGRLIVMLCWVPQDLDRLGVQVRTTGGGTLRLGAYAHAGRAGNLLAEGVTTVALSSGAVQEVSVSVPGQRWVWLAALGENVTGTPTVRSCSPGNSWGPWDRTNQIFGLAPAAIVYYVDSVAAGALPDPFPGSINGATDAFIMSGRYA